MVDRLGVHRADQADVVRNGTNAWQELAQPAAGLAVLAEGFQRREDGVGLLRRRHGRETRRGPHRFGQFLQSHRRETGFVVEEIHLRGPAALPEQDDTLGPGGKVGQSGAAGPEAGKQVALKEGTEGGDADAGGRAAEELTSRHLQVGGGEGRHDLVSVSSRLSRARQTAA